MKRRGSQSGQSNYETLDPFPGRDHELRERDTTARIARMMIDQKREQSRRALPELSPASSHEGYLETIRDPSENDPNSGIQLQSRPKAVFFPRLRRRTVKRRVSLFVLFCLLFFSGFMSTAIMLAGIIALLFILILGPESVLDALLPNWRKHLR